MSNPGTHPLAPRPAGWYPDPAGTGGQRWHDGQGWTAQLSPGSTARAQARALGPGFARLADWLGRMLGLWAVVCLLLAAVPAWYWANPPRIPLQNDPSATRAALDRFDDLGAALLLVLLVLAALALTSGVTWLVWQYQLAVSAPVALRRSPAGHVFWWFVPFASYWIPRSNIGDLWRAYGRQRQGEPGEPTPAVFSVWWALVLAPVLLEPVFMVLMQRAYTIDDALNVFFGYLTIGLVVAGLTAYTARSVVRDLSWRALLYWADAH